MAVTPGSAAEEAGLRAGDVIIGANKRRVIDIESLRSALRLSENSVLLHINRNGGSLFIVIR